MFCPDCGKTVSKDDLFCGNCGKQLRAIFVPLKPQPEVKQNRASNIEQKPAQSSYPSAFSKPQTGVVSKYAPKPQPKPAAAPKPQPKPQPQPASRPKPQPQPEPQQASSPKPQPEPQPQPANSPKPEPQPVSAAKPEQNAAPKTVQPVFSIPQQGNLPQEVCFTGIMRKTRREILLLNMSLRMIA